MGHFDSRKLGTVLHNTCFYVVLYQNGYPTATKTTSGLNRAGGRLVEKNKKKKEDSGTTPFLKPKVKCLNLSGFPTNTTFL